MKKVLVVLVVLFLVFTFSATQFVFAGDDATYVKDIKPFYKIILAVDDYFKNVQTYNSYSIPTINVGERRLWLD